MMEISPWLIYWLMQLDSICNFVNFISVIGTIIIMTLFIFRTVWKTRIHYDDDYEVAYNATTLFSKLLCIIVPLFILINVFIPNTKTVASMIIIPPIVNNEQVQQLPNDVLVFIHSIVEEYSLNKKEKK